jgi:hypothetical protein
MRLSTNVSFTKPVRGHCVVLVLEVKLGKPAIMLFWMYFGES